MKILNVRKTVLRNTKIRFGFCKFKKCFPSRAERAEVEKKGWYFASHEQLTLLDTQILNKNNKTHKLLFGKNLIAFGTYTKSWPAAGGKCVQSYYYFPEKMESLGILVDSSLAGAPNEKCLALVLRLDSPKKAGAN